MAVLTPLARTTLADGAYQSILRNILSGALAGGTELSESGLAEELRISRTPIREAVGRLLSDGLLEEYERGKLRVSRFTRDDLDEIYSMRLLLEPAAAERAATRMAPEGLAALRREADALAGDRRAGGWNERALEFDVRFHDVLARSSGNARLEADIARYRLLVRAFCRLTGGSGNLEQAFREHLRILEALEARDGARARDAMKAHIEARHDAVSRQLYPEAT